jgi:glycosidase
MVDSSSRAEVIAGCDNVLISVAASPLELCIRYHLPGPIQNPLTIYLAFGTYREIGAAVLPFSQFAEGSTVFLPFKSDLFLIAEVRDNALRCFLRKWERWSWSEREETRAFEVTQENDEFTFWIPRTLLGEAQAIDFTIYAKDPGANNGWGWMWGCADQSVDAGLGDKYLRHYYELRLGESDASLLTRRGRYRCEQSKIRIYQLFVRLFSNVTEKPRQNGTILENGVGKFNQITGTAITSLREMGFTHLWLTGVLQQATGTDYSPLGRPADDADLLKGIAGSPYAIKDYFDVCPDYAEKPEDRLLEFKALIDRIHEQDLKVLIDFVPNHVARSYHSAVKPEFAFGVKGNGGQGDDRSKFFDPQNNFFYLQLGSQEAPLRLPAEENAALLSACDGLFSGEFDHCKVTGNNVASWAPSPGDWYETVKLNYGFDFTIADKSVREYPSALAPDKPLPDTWKKMDHVIEYWQGMGVDGFRCDMAHMVPPEFWNWLIHRARRRSPDVIFIGEAYDNDPMKVPGSDPVISRLNGKRGNVMFDLLNAGFNAVYDDPTYKALKNIYDGQGWANDIDQSLGYDFIFDNSLRYAENHDEVRLAAASQWLGIGMAVGRPVAAVLYGLSRGPAMLYNGQEVGEPADGAEGFGGNDARTSIFDYWAMPELRKWVNKHRYDGAGLSAAQKALREFYARLVKLSDEPAFRDGEFFPLNPANRDNPNFGRLPNEQPSGHWLYAFLRYDRTMAQRFLILANFHPSSYLRDVGILLSDDAIKFLGLSGDLPNQQLKLTDRLAANYTAEINSTVAEALGAGIPIKDIPPLTPFYLELTAVEVTD